MIGRLKKLFDRPSAGDTTTNTDALPLAAAALLVEAAFMDGTIDDAERETIKALLGSQFGLNEDETSALLAEGEAAVQETGDLYKFTRVLKDAFSPDERVRILEMLWTVALADGRVDHFESNLIRRIAGLLYVSDMDSGLAKKRVIAETQSSEQEISEDR